MALELVRLASFINFPQTETIIFCTELARFGYVYTGSNMDIECETCRTRVHIQENWEKMKHISMHTIGCVFYNNSTEDAASKLGAVASGTIGTNLNLQGDMNDLEADGCTEPQKLMTKPLNHFDDSNYSTSYMLPSQEKNNLYATNFQCAETVNNKEKQDLLASSTVNSSSDTTNYTTVDAIEFFDFPDLFYSEYFGFNSHNDLSFSTSYVRECEKNPGHFAYFTLSNLILEQIPSTFRCSEMLKLLKLMGDLTVRITVSSTSSRRKLRHKTPVNQSKRRSGTGFVIEHACRGKPPSQKSKFTSIRKMLPIWKQTNVSYVYIQTSRQLVYDDEEAHKTVVEFSLDSLERKNVFSLEGKYVLGSVTPGDNQCLLVCECSDSGFIQRLNQLQQEFYELADGLPIKVKKGMLKKLFMVHHPHGGPKVLSYGDFVKIKYKYSKESASNQPVLTKLTNQEPVGLDATSYRRSLIYAADTCPGSCGAPILTFIPRPGNSSGATSLQVEIWMHNGVETTHNLGVSGLKACTVDDLTPIQDGLLTSQEEDSEDEDSLGKQKVDSPVYKVISSLAHPEHAMYQSRLDSFHSWTCGNILKPESLASAGFYYTGVADSVRCFQCGLGLRSWKSGDDVIAEHKKHGPSCPYLKLLLNGRASAGAVADPVNIEDSATSQSVENVMVTLLEKENREWRRQLTCKICFKSDVKDVFLPCGELYACSDCSKLLTHCPSCKKPILATITVYMT